jgi:hypothetical protein
VKLTEIVDYWSEHYLFDDADLCDKELYLNHAVSESNFEYTYSDPDLSLTQPGEYSYFFTMVDY